MKKTTAPLVKSLPQPCLTVAMVIFLWNGMFILWQMQRDWKLFFLLNFRDHQDVYFFLVSSFLPGSLPQMPFFSWALSYCWNRKFDLNWVSYFVPHLFFAMPLLSTSTVLYWYLSIFSMVVMTSCYKWACQHCWVKTATMLSIHIAVLFLFCLFLENTAWKINERIVAFYCFVNNISSYYCSRDSLPQ